MPNVIISPHSSSHTYTMEIQRRQIFADNLERFIKGEKLHHICNKKEGF